jgi:DNA helicase-4
MIDEFQDVSPLFMRLVEAIRAVNPRLAVMGVGDDWQAINGFAGATTDYFQNFGRHFPGAGHLELLTNYRSGSRIVAAGNTIMARKGRPARAGRSYEGSVEEADISEFFPVAGEQKDDSRRIAALRRLGQHHLKNKRTVALLSRTRQASGLGKHWVAEFKRDLHPAAEELVTGSTVHQYKGKEAEVVIVVDAGPNAFPIIGKQWYLYRVFGDTQESLLEAEQRLLYVAVTRAAESLVLVTDGSRERGGLTDLIGTAVDDILMLEWDDYPPLGAESGAVCRIEVSNLGAGWQDSGGTIPIKHLLKQHDFKYVPEPIPKWVRTTVVPENGGTKALWPTMMQESWVREADKVLVRFFLGGREDALVAITAGKWNDLNNA